MSIKIKKILNKRLKNFKCFDSCISNQNHWWASAFIYFNYTHITNQCICPCWVGISEITRLKIKKRDFAQFKKQSRISSKKKLCLCKKYCKR